MRERLRGSRERRSRGSWWHFPGLGGRGRRHESGQMLDGIIPKSISGYVNRLMTTQMKKQARYLMMAKWKMQMRPRPYSRPGANTASAEDG